MQAVPTQRTLVRQRVLTGFLVYGKVPTGCGLQLSLGGTECGSPVEVVTTPGAGSHVPIVLLKDVT